MNFKEVFNHPAVKVSDHYINLFNEVSEELGYKIKYEEAKDKLGDPIVNKVMETIEARRLRIAKNSYEQFNIQKSTATDKLEILTEGEKKWVKNVSEKLTDLSQEVYARQARHDAEELLDWMNKFGDSYFKAHFLRIRDVEFPAIKNNKNIPEGLSDNPDDKLYYKKFSNPFPWFPEKTKYASGVWPIDLTEEEIDSIKKKYETLDEILRPYTIVERQGKEYKVTNISKHKRFADLFKKFASVLKENSEIEGLNQSFREYTKSMADCLVNGDYTKLLASDINQYEGNLYLTFFPHEGYWADNIKFPFYLLIGIRDKDFKERMSKYSEGINKLEAYTAKILQEAGYDYKAREIDISNVHKSCEVAWMHTSGGYGRAFPIIEPIGTDYPKVSYPGVDIHREVIWLEATYAKFNHLKMPIAKELLSDEDFECMDFSNLVTFALGHETTHGTGPRPESVLVKNGKAFGEVFKKMWGSLVEPWADIGAMILFKSLLDDGKITKQEYKKLQVDYVVDSVRKFAPKESAKSDFYIENAPHSVGMVMYLGWLTKNNVVKLEDKKFKINWDNVEKANDSFFRSIVKLSGSQDATSLVSFISECVDYLPDSVAERIGEVRGKLGAEVLVDRGFIGKIAPR